MKNKDIVVVGLQSWDLGVGSNCRNIALELARNNRVLYVNRALDRVSYLRHRSDLKVRRRLQSLRGQQPDLQQDGSGVWVLDPRVMLESVNWMPEAMFRHFNRINNIRLAGAIREACARLGFGSILLFIDNDFFRARYLPELLRPESSIYYIRDFLTRQAYFRKHGPAHEAELMQEVDVVAANSQYLANYARQYNVNTADIGQGCDFTYFNPAVSHPKPAELEGVPKPIIGYVGALVGYRLDIPLLEDLAQHNPQWQWVLVGPEDEAFASSKLHAFSNVHFTGPKPEAQLSAYLRHFDVCINPQLVNEATIGNYPRKVDEYLAMGKPVVATRTEFMQVFARYVHLASGAAEYEAALKLALQECSNSELSAGRMAFARTHTWEASVNKLGALHAQWKLKKATV